MFDSLSPVALSRLTWSADDRRAWDETYRAALIIDAARSLVPGWTYDGCLDWEPQGDEYATPVDDVDTAFVEKIAKQDADDGVDEPDDRSTKEEHHDKV